MKAAFHTLGCKVNSYDTNSIIAEFKRNGYEIVSFDEVADVYVINTCTVTGTGDFKSRQAIRRAKKLNPEAIVIAVGCYAQTKPEELSELREVDIISGTADRKNIVELVNIFKNEIDTSGKIINVVDILKNKEYEELPADTDSNRTRAFIKVQDGCSCFCSYCIIPFARGPSRSRNIEDIVAEAKKLADLGYKEVVLTGIHLASYKDNNDRNTGLSGLTARISEVYGIERIRLGSLDPEVFTDAFIKEISRIEKLCPHFHISLQSGCESTLKRMNRRYIPEQYYESVMKIRENIPDVAVTTDIMVGFPGETDEEFKASCVFVRKVEFSNMHVFKYSSRKGTKAAKMTGQVPKNIKEERSRIMLDIGSSYAYKYNSRFVGRVLPVLFETGSKGLTPHYVSVKINGELINEPGIIKNVYIVNADENGLAGTIK